MPTSKNPPDKRNYKREYAEYQGTPEQIKHREERNKLHAQEVKKVGHKLVGDVAHIKSLKAGGPNSLSNARVESINQNRSWRKGQKGYKVPVDK
jgi:hypothetical protein